MTSDKTTLDFEDLLLEVGDSGRYQKKLIVFFLLPAATLLPWFSMNILFMVSVPDHWCYVPEVAISNLTTEQQRKLISPPENPKCNMYSVNYTEYVISGIDSIPDNTSTKPCDNGWDFDRTYYDSTVATQQIQQVLEEDGVAEGSWTIAIYKKLESDGIVGPDIDSITLTSSCDGGAVSKSSKGSLWPIQFRINELPPKEKFLPHRLMVAGFLFGKHEPVPATFLKPFFGEINSFSCEPVKWTEPHTGTLHTTKVYVTYRIFDAPAKCLFLSFTQFNEYYSCPYCYHPGTLDKKQWNMFCKDDHYTSFVLTLYSVGSIIGTPFYSALSDRIGRKIVFFIVLTITAVTALASVFMTNFTAFVIIRTINGGLMPSVFQLPYIIVLELVAPEMRTHMNGLVNSAWTIGLSFLPLVAYLSRGWVTLGIVTSSVTLIFYVYWKFLPESPRWLLSQERYDEAMVVMQKIADTNGKSPDPDQLLLKLKAVGEKIKKERIEDNVQNSSMDLLRYPQLRKIFIIISFCWIADVMSYYGLQINISNLAGNEFINFFLMAIVEIPGFVTCWILMNRFGRRWCAVGCFFMAGITCMLPAIVSGYAADIICSMLGKFSSAAAFMATYQQGSELYPTVVRSLGLGMSCTIAMIVSLAIPYLIYLGVYGKAIPFVVIASTSLIAGVLAMFLPETLNENLPQTISDIENFGKDQKFFAINTRRRSLCRERAASLPLQIKRTGNSGVKDTINKDESISSLHQYEDFLDNEKDVVILNDLQKNK